MSMDSSFQALLDSCSDISVCGRSVGELRRWEEGEYGPVNRLMWQKRKIRVVYRNEDGTISYRWYSRSDLSGYGIEGVYSLSDMSRFTMISNSAEGSGFPLAEPFDSLLGGKKENLLEFWDNGHIISGIGMQYNFSNFPNLSVLKLPACVSCTTHQFNDNPRLSSIDISSMQNLGSGSFGGKSLVRDVFIDNDVMKTVPGGFGTLRILGVGWDSVNQLWSLKFAAGKETKAISSDVVGGVTDWALQSSPYLSLYFPNLSVINGPIFEGNESVTDVVVDNSVLKSVVDSGGHHSTVVERTEGEYTKLKALALGCTSLSTDAISAFQVGWNSSSHLGEFHISNDYFHTYLEGRMVVDSLSTTVCFMPIYSQVAQDFLNERSCITAINGYSCRNSAAETYPHTRESSVRLRYIRTLPIQMFYGQSKLYNLSLDNCTTIGVNALNKCSKLSSLTLGTTERVVNLKGIPTGIPSTFKIYVPSSMYDAYIVDTNWVRLKDKIHVIGE